MSTEEKRRRIYYQNIVYDVCIVLDRILETHIVCGTLNSPSNEVQEAIRDIERIIDRPPNPLADGKYEVQNGKIKPIITD